MAEFASKGVAGAGLGLGIAGTALWLLNGGVGLVNNMTAPAMAYGYPGGGCNGGFATNRDLTYIQELAGKDAKIEMLEAEKYSDQKLIDVYTKLDGDIKELSKRMNDFEKEQLVYNGVNTATLSCMQGQIAALQALTSLVIKNDKVCPGWGDVTNTPATAATTAATAA